LLAGVAGGVTGLGAALVSGDGAAPELPVEPVLPVEGLLMGEDDEPGAAESVFLPQAPSASAAAIASAVTAMEPNLLSYMSISFQD
jgi:hypothetical protein